MIGEPRHSSIEPREALKLPLYNLERYAGWLAKDHVSVAVRADVQALAGAVGIGHDPSELLLTLGQDIARLPGGDIRKMLRKTFTEIRALLGPDQIAVHDRGDS